MKKKFMLLMFVLPMAMASHHALAQEVTMDLLPGWNWICYPFPETVSLNTAFSSITPTNGDIVKSKFGSSTYLYGQWRGAVHELIAGEGYHYYSKASDVVTLVFGAAVVLPTVTTATPTDITTYGMTCGGEVTDTGSSGVLVRGVCWSTQQNPTIDDAHTTDGYGTGSFSSTAEGLEMSTTYYVRAYAMTASGTGYGEQVMFSTKNGVPVLTTSAASEIGVTWATCGGDISDDGGMEVNERGICWSTDHNPTIAGNHCANGSGLGSFSVNMNYLDPNTTYYVRAYATNNNTTAYGNEIFFQTEVAQTWQIGMLPGQFSVSATQQVQFSQGNLQYIGSAATPYWRFAEHQWDYLGNNGQGSTNQNVDRDLFGWGTSGYNHGANCYQPWSTMTMSSEYYAYGNYQYNLNDQTGQADWGYNPILNGGNTENSGWHTLNRNEWNYIFNTRSTPSGIRYAKAQVHGNKGVILLPDDWDATLYALNYTNNTQAPFNTNIIDDADWATMEIHGAVFLPEAGFRSSSNSFIGGSGWYWSSSCSSTSSAYYMYFNNNNLYSAADNRYLGFSVRLARSAQVYSIEATSNPSEGGTVTGGGDYQPNTTCTLTATPNEGYIFTNWTENGEVVSTEATYSFTVTSDRTLVANFEQTYPTGAINGKFTFNSDGDQVYFSQGNLQYIGSVTTPYWKFADSQWEYLGTTTGQNSTNQNVDRDLFGWGTSGYNHGAVCYQPWSTSQTNSDYYAYGSYSYHLFNQTGQADWGYNPISNGGNQPNQWRTLTTNEWVYIFNTRETTSGIRYAKAKVNDVNGVILLPDNWNTLYYTLNNTNSSSASFSSNVVTASQWSSLELHGAVFLPAAGDRNGTSVYEVGSAGYYWSSYIYNIDCSYYVGFGSSGLYPQNNYTVRYFGFSVRLVRNAQ